MKAQPKKNNVITIPPIRKILYATDLSNNSSYAFVYAVDMAAKHGAGIVILHVVEAGRPVSYAGTLVESVMKGAVKKEKEADLRRIKKGIESFCQAMAVKTGQPCAELVSRTIVSTGYPVEEILNTVENERCDAIVLGTHAKGFLKHAFLGSVAVSVLERTRKPVFVIPVPPEDSAANWGNV